MSTALPLESLNAAAQPRMEPVTHQSRGPVPGEDLVELMERSDAKAWIQVMTFFGAIVVTGCVLALTWGTWATIPLFLAHGTLLAHTYAAQHEFLHLTPFRTRFLNYAFGHICAFINFWPFNFDRTSHMLHHQYTGQRGEDTELDHSRPEREPFTLGAYLWWMLALPYFVRLAFMVFQRAAGLTLPREHKHLSDAERRMLVLEGRIYSSLYLAILIVSVATGSWLAIKVWIAPLIAMKWTHQIHQLTEHYGLAKVDDIMVNTRTIYTTPLNRWLLWNMGYHTAHHRYANVPFYNLKQLDRKLRNHVGHAYVGYLRFHWDIIRSAWTGRRYGYEGLM